MYLYPVLSESYYLPNCYLILLIDQTAIYAKQELLGSVEKFKNAHCLTEEIIIGGWDFVYKLGVILSYQTQPISFEG